MTEKKMVGWPAFALSIKQPWAALLVSGQKTIEIRSWPTFFRGRVLIHSGRIPDKRPEVLALVPEELRELASLNGGIVGAGTLKACKAYRNRSAFVRDKKAHWNDPSWFAPAGMFGFVFTKLEVLPFHPCKGNLRIFAIDIPIEGSA
jgi:hypothetical protein